MVIDNNITTSGFMDDKIIELKKGDKIIKRRKVDWEKNQDMWKFRGYSLVEDKPTLSLVPKKKKSKK